MDASAKVRGVGAALTALGLMLLTGSCAKDLGALVPYACPDNGRCPDGLGCVPGVGCTQASLDTVCFANSWSCGASDPFCTDEQATDCSRAAPGAECSWLHVCATPCDASGSCGARRVCAVAAGVAPDKAFCLAECSGNDECPGGLACRPLAYDDRRACMPALECQSQGDCPAGLSCSPTFQCVPPALDSLCDSDTDCAVAAAGGVCDAAFGMCEQPCGASGGCPTGRVCSVPPGTGGDCLIDCSSGQPCPDGRECHGLLYSGRRACVPIGRGLAACEKVTASACGVPVTHCGAGQENWSVACLTEGPYCPTNSSCFYDASSDNFGCRCDYGYTATTCGGSPCDGGCAYPDWWCAPDQVRTPGCNADPSGFSGTCTCRYGVTVSFSCATTESCEDACQRTLGGYAPPPPSDGGVPDGGGGQVDPETVTVSITALRDMPMFVEPFDVWQSSLRPVVVVFDSSSSELPVTIDADDTFDSHRLDPGETWFDPHQRCTLGTPSTVTITISSEQPWPTQVRIYCRAEAMR